MGGLPAPSSRCPLQGVTMVGMANKVDDTVPQRPRAVVCLSGGMDSAVCAALAARDYDAYALHFSYGQRTERRELESARAVAETLGFAKFFSRSRSTSSARSAARRSPTPQSPSPTPRQTEPIRRVGPRHLRPLPQRAFPLRRGKLGRGSGREEGLHRRRRAGQLRLSRLPSRLLRGLSTTYPHRNSRRRHRSRHAAHPYAEE